MVVLAYPENVYASIATVNMDFIRLYDNETAAAVARHVGTSDWRLPIYHYDDYENWEVMQYYDIPSRYEIPSNPEQVTEEKAGTVYYSEPNRIIRCWRAGAIKSFGLVMVSENEYKGN